MDEEAIVGASPKIHEHDEIMLGRDGMTSSRIVVSLWTIQSMTVLFLVVSLSIWLAVVSGMSFDHALLRIMGIAFLVLLLILALAAEFRLYVRNMLSVMAYMRLQIIKAALWTVLLLLLLGTVSGVEDEGVKIFWEAAKKLFLPFLASVMYSAVLYRRERAMKARMNAGSDERLPFTTDEPELGTPS